MTATAVEAPLDLRVVWQRWRLPVVLVLLAIAVAVGLAAVENAPPERPLDPRDASPVGGRAVAQLLLQRGIEVDATTHVPAAGEATTVFVPDPRSLTSNELDSLTATPGDLVVVAPSARELRALGFPAQLSGVTDEHTVPAGCGFTPASVAGTVRFGGLLYTTGQPLAQCYSPGGGAGLLVQSRPGGRTVVFGSARALSNSRLRDQGNAALALGLLSAHPRVQWLLPRPPTSLTADRQHKGLLRLLPDRLLWTLLQVLVVVLLVALWRGRRVGPVIAEPLPVVVPAAEAVRGRARLLRAARARGAAAEELRTASARRIADVLGLGPQAVAGAVVAATADRTGRGGSEVDSLLYGAEPQDDEELVRLAQALDDLETSVRRG